MLYKPDREKGKTCPFLKCACPFEAVRMFVSGHWNLTGGRTDEQREVFFKLKLCASTVGLV